MSKFKGFITEVGIVAVLGAAVFGGQAAHASVVTPTSVAASSSFNGYGAGYADDTAANTDWAAGGTGAGSYLNISFAGPVSFGIVQVTDRVTSGGAQGSFAGGTGDFTTRFSLQAYTSSAFTTTTGNAVIGTATTPSQPTTPANFITDVDLTGITSQFLRYTVLATNGSNPGVDDITFNTSQNTSDTSVPEPVSIALLLSGVGLSWACKRRRAA